MIGAIARAEQQDAAQRQRQGERDDVQHRLATLTPRQREVLGHVVAGRLNKQIAGDLGTMVRPATRDGETRRLRCRVAGSDG